MNEKFEFTDAAFMPNGNKIPQSELIIASIEINKDGTGSDNPNAKALIEDMLKTTGAILSMYHTNVYDTFLLKLQELREYVNSVCDFTIEDAIKQQIDLFEPSEGEEEDLILN